MVSTHRRSPFWAGLGLCLIGAALRAADMLLWTDAATGFAIRGPVLLRCAVLAALVLCLRLLAAKAQPAPAGLRRPARPLALALAAISAVLLAQCAIQLAAGAAADLLPALLAAVGFGMLAQRASHLDAPVPRAWPGLLPLPWLALLAARRALLAPASVSRLPATLRVLSMVAALLYYMVLLRALYLPAEATGQTLFTAGFACLLIGTGVELPLALQEFANGTLPAGELCGALALGVLGAAGAVCAWLATGPGLDTLD